MTRDEDRDEELSLKDELRLMREQIVKRAETDPKLRAKLAAARAKLGRAKGGDE